MSPLFLFGFLLLLLLLSSPYSTTGSRKHPSHNQVPASDLVRTSCVHANYPNLCLRTLAAYSGPARTPHDLAKAAVNVSLAHAGRVSKYLGRTAAAGSGGGGGGGASRQRAALEDCVEQIGDSVEELRKTLKELKHLRGDTFGWQMSNAQTWVSAALTNEDTCLDGFQDVSGELKADLRRKITKVARVTSNALYMINRLDQARRRTP